ncbi:MAG: hypothetical protein NC033_06600 [Clostridiales bacterium]|nr:hypothetical protein [Clostridiales bacterium]
MKKKVIIAALATICAVSGVAALTACDNGGSGHTHDYDTTKWVMVSDEMCAHPCKVDGCTSVSGAEPHNTESSTTATCTDGGDKTTACTRCEYSVTEHEDALGHDWDLEDPDAPTHTHGGTLKCKREGCGESQSSDRLPYHLGESEDVGKFTVYTCEDCGTEVAEVNLNFKKRIDDSRTEDYTGATIKVALYKIGEESDTPDYEATADSATGRATFKIAEGAYWVKVTDETNDYVSADATYIRFVKASAESDYPTRDIILSEKAEYKVKFTYGGTTPATGVKVQVYPNYRYNGTITAPVIGEGVTDENGEVTFNLASSFDMVNADNCGLRISDYNETDYKTLSGLGLAETDQGTTKSFVFEPKQRAFTIKVKAGENYVSGFTVKFYEKEYNAETETWDDKIIATYVAEGDSVVTEAMENVSKSFYIELPDEITENWELPTWTVIDPETKEESKVVKTFSTNTKTGETVIELKEIVKVQIVTYKIVVAGPRRASGVNVIFKDASGAKVAEGTTLNGILTIKLALADYTVEIDTATLPSGYTSAEPIQVKISDLSNDIVTGTITATE